MRRIDIAGQWRRFQILILSCGRLQIRRNGCNRKIAPFFAMRRKRCIFAAMGVTYYFMPFVVY